MHRRAALGPGSMTLSMALSMALSAAASAAALLDVSRSVVDFGGHATVARPQTFVVTNVGDAPWDVPGMQLDGVDAALFSVASMQCPARTRVPPRGRCVFEIGFVPHGTGMKHATMRIAGTGDSIALRGAAVPARARPLGPIALIFSRGIDLAFPLSETIEVSNAGDEPLRIVGMRIEGRQPAEFEIASACELPAVLQLAEHCWITVSMTGLGAEPWSAELVVETAELGAYRLGVTGYRPPAREPLVP
jgi:hypothetical protein